MDTFIGDLQDVTGTGRLNHCKLIGGSLRTASHDAQRIKDARKSVQDANKAEADRASRRFSHNHLYDDGL